MAVQRALAAILLLQVFGLAQTGIISTIAGRTAVNGAPARGFDGDGKAAGEAALALANLVNGCDPGKFEQASHLTVDARSNIYFADSNNQRIRRIDAAGTITTVAGSGETPAIDARCQPLGSTGDGGSAVAARLFNPAAVVVHPNGNLLIADQQNNRIRQVTPAGAITTVAGSGLHNFYAPNIPATSSPMDWPSSLALDANGVLYFAELHSNRVGRLGLDGRLATVAGTGFPGFNGDRIAANTATLTRPAGIAFARDGSLLIADTGNHRIRRVAADGTIATIAGNGRQAFCGDGGRAEEACLDTPMDVQADALGNLYVADTGNHRVRRIDAAGNIQTVAGTGEPGRGADGVAADRSALNFPSALAVDGNNDLYIVDWQNYLIRKVTFGASISAGGIVNGASFTAPAAPGALISIFGTGFAPETVMAADGPLPLALGGIGVEVNGKAIPLSLVSVSQVNAQLPYEAEAGTATMTITGPSIRSAATRFEIAATAVGIFADLAGAAIAVNQAGKLNSAATPETRGNVMVFYVTGLGAVAPPVESGQKASLETLSYAVVQPVATVGGVPAKVHFAGLAPGFIGVGQMNIEIPADAPAGDAVAIVIEAGGQRSKAATVALR